MPSTFFDENVDVSFTLFWTVAELEMEVVVVVVVHQFAGGGGGGGGGYQFAVHFDRKEK